MTENVERIRRILDKQEVYHRLVEPEDENEHYDIVFSIPKTDDCIKSILCVLAFMEHTMTLKAYVTDYTLEKSNLLDAILFCNTWSQTHFMPKVFILTSCNPIASCTYDLTPDLTDEYIWQHMILFFIQTSREFYRDFLNTFAGSGKSE